MAYGKRVYDVFGGDKELRFLSVLVMVTTSTSSLTVSGGWASSGDRDR